MPRCQPDPVGRRIVQHFLNAITRRRQVPFWGETWTGHSADLCAASQPITGRQRLPFDLHFVIRDLLP